MRATADDQLFSADEIARAAGVPVKRVVGLLGAAEAASAYAPKRTAIRLVRQLTRRGQASRAPISLIAESRRKQGVPLFLSGTLHTLFLLSLLLVTSGLLTADDTEQEIVEPK